MQMLDLHQRSTDHEPVEITTSLICNILILLDFRLTKQHLLNYSVTVRVSLSTSERPYTSYPFQAHMRLITHKFHPSFRNCFDNTNINNSFCFYLELGYFNLVMSYSTFYCTSREIALFSITYIGYTLLKVHIQAYCTLYCLLLLRQLQYITKRYYFARYPLVEFYFFCTYITIRTKLPYKSILMPDNSFE